MRLIIVGSLQDQLSTASKIAINNVASVTHAVDIDMALKLIRSKGADLLMVDVKLDINNSYTKAKVAQIYPVADQQKHTVTVKFDLPEGTPGGPGLYAEVTINDTTAERRLVPVIPKDAVIYRGSLPSVYILDDNNSAKMRVVRLGSDYDETRVTVLSGISSGDRIISSPPKTIRSGWKPDIESKSSNSDSEG